MHELRIVSGLHRGATLPLDDQPHVIGASDADDVVLVDPGIEAGHATLSRNGSGWLLSAGNGVICGADSNQPMTLVDLKPGEFARLDKVWMCVAAQDAPWENPPPEPVDTPLFDAAGDEDEADSPSAVHAEAGSATVQAARPARRSRRRVMYIPLALAAVLSAAAYAITSRPDQPAANLDIRSDMRQGSKGRLDAPPAGAKQETEARAKKPSAQAERLTPAELRDAFRKRLADADLLKHFDLNLKDDSWTMQAALDDEETRRFERILAAFMSTHDIAFPVHAKVGKGELMLPFKIRQVVSGSHASIVTQDGERLYVGDEYLGIRVVAIQGNHLTFAGKRKIEVIW
ncbi:MAG TPA: FHA domain-containing protein [Noviherbaspirillum sp.]|nr:FHA domain-containing protein [Noviherbaspirillum sp.]